MGFTVRSQFPHRRILNVSRTLSDQKKPIESFEGAHQSPHTQHIVCFEVKCIYISKSDRDPHILPRWLNKNVDNQQAFEERLGRTVRELSKFRRIQRALRGGAHTRPIPPNGQNWDQMACKPGSVHHLRGLATIPLG